MVIGKGIGGDAANYVKSVGGKKAAQNGFYVVWYLRFALPK